jgi:DnaB-like helicase N terminal domain/AAA domain
VSGVTGQQRPRRIRQPEPPAAVGRIPPHDLEAEEATLGAMMVSAEALVAVHDQLREEDFYRPAHRVVFVAIRSLTGRSHPVDPVTVGAELAHDGSLTDIGGAPFLHTLVAAVPLPANAGHYARIVIEQARLRRLIDAGTQITQLGYEDGQDAAQAGDQARKLVEVVATDARDGQAVDALDLDAFLDEEELEYDWQVPGLIEREDRIGLTGGEGTGKSTLLRQLGVQVASGIHPFTLEHIDPLRVLLVDLESSHAHVRRELRKLRLAAGDAYQAGGLHVITRPQGLDLFAHPDDAGWLDREVAAARADLLAIGPAYKMASGDPTKEEVVRAIQRPLDDLRSAYRVAVLLELHTGHASTVGGRRPERPIGASAWLRWPEFGLHLRTDGSLGRWRVDRDGRDWPAALRRGGAWPWTIQENPREVVWARILQHVDETGRCASIRVLAEALATTKYSVEAAVGAHRSQWQTLCDALGEIDE